MGALLRTRTCSVFQAILVVFFIMETKAFNIDTDWPLVFTHDDDKSLFGFSVALHQEGTQRMILVGAPNANDEGSEVDHEGALYRCDIGEHYFTSPCSKVPLGEFGQPRDENNRQYGNKSHSFLGATVRSAGKNGPILVCAPSYVWYITPSRGPNDDSTFREPVGRCYIIQNNFNDIEKYEPCVDKEDDDTYFESKLTHCQAGIGGDVSRDHVLIGGPGSFYWQGQIFYQDINLEDPPLKTWEAPYSFDDSYRGYTVLFGDLNDDGRLDNIVGMPRAPNMFGMVSVYDHRLRPLYNKTGHQLGEYFGNSLAVTDLNNDNLDDLIVGAPMYTDQEQRTQNFEIGRIYVFYQYVEKNKPALSNKKTIVGRVGNGRFGFSVTAIGDINKDGFNDIAVGAPFDGDGAVYIFKGGQRGIITSVMQVIRTSDLHTAGSPLKAFGFSLAGNLDMDGNSYPDLAVGAYGSSHAVVLRARPIIKIEASITFDVENIDLQNRNFNLSDSMEVPGFNITTCIKYKGGGLASDLPFNFTLKLDLAKTVFPRAFIYENNQHLAKKQWDHRLTKKVEYCESFTAYVQNIIRDKINPIQFQFTYMLDTEEMKPMLQSGELLPLLNDEQSYIIEQLVLLANCSNERCLPDLKVDIDHDLTEVSVGQKEILMVDVNYVNDGEEAFEARLHALMPAGVTFVQVENLGSGLLVECQEFLRPSHSNLVCDVGNPVRARYQVPFRLHFEVNVEDKKNEHVHIAFHANSSNLDDEATMHDNSKNISIPLYITSQLSFTGYSNPGQLVYSTNFSLPEDVTNLNENEVGMEVVHYYIFENSGPSDIGESVLTVQWPLYTEDDEYLLYLTSVSPTTGECDYNEELINPKNLKLEYTEEAINDTLDRARSKVNRRRRDNKPGTYEKPTAQPQVKMDCNIGKCVEIMCRFDRLAGNGQPIVLSIRSRLWVKTLLQDIEENAILPSDWIISSNGSLEIVSDVYSIPNPRPEIFTFTTTTKAAPEAIVSFVKAVVPWWVYLLGALIGFIILSCLIMTAWKLGFFKRKKIGEDEKAFT